MKKKKVKDPKIAQIVRAAQRLTRKWQKSGWSKRRFAEELGKILEERT